eukprot:gene9663-biopygen1699
MRHRRRRCRGKGAKNEEKCSTAGAAKQDAQTSRNSPVGSHCDTAQSNMGCGMDWFGCVE